MNPLANPAYLLPPLAAAGFAGALCLVVARKALTNAPHRYFTLFLLAIGAWSFLIYLMRSSPDTTGALFWERFALPVTLLSAPSFYFFTRVYTRKPPGTIAFALLISYILLVAVFAANGMLVQRMVIESYGYAPILAPTFYPVAVAAYGWIGAGIAGLYRAYRASKVYEERNRHLYVVVATAFPAVGAVIDIFPSTYPASILGNLVFATITTVAMRRYHLLDINLVLRKGLAYLIMSAIVAVPYVSAIYLATQVFQSDEFNPVFNFLLLLVLALTLQPLWSQVQVVVDRLFFRRRWDSFRALEEFTKRSHSIAELSRPAEELVGVIRDAVQAENVSLLLANDFGDFEPVAHRGKEPGARLRIARYSPVITWMEREQRPVEKQSLYLDPQLQAISASESDALETAGVVMLIPLRMRDRLSGILALGPKLSDAPYSGDELTLLTVVAAQTAVLLDDARLYENLSSQLELGRKRLAAFREAAMKLALEVDAERALQDLVETAKGLIEADTVELLLPNLNGNGRKRFQSGVAPDKRQSSLRLGQDEILADSPSAFRAPAAPNSINVGFAAPTGGEATLQARKGFGRPFSQDDERILSLFGVLAQVLLQNIALYGEVTQERSTLAAVQSSMTEGLMVVSPHGEIDYCNEAAAQMIGLDATTRGIGRQAKEVLEARAEAMESQERLRELLAAFEDSSLPLEPVTLRIKDPRPADIAATPFPIPTGTNQRMLGVLFRDVTEEVDLERRRNEFVSIASHELRTPLSTLLGFSELLLARAGDPASRRNWLEFIHRDSLRLTSIVDDLLNVSRIQSGRVDVQMKPVLLDQVVAQVIQGARGLDTGHTFITKGMDQPLPVLADSGKLTQVLTNLINNAAKYSPNGGTVTVEAAPSTAPGTLVVRVTDEGIGIAPADQERLFTTFYRIDRAETRGIRGSGLGLYIVKNFVEMMGGSIWIESEVNKGSTFSFTLSLVGNGRPEAASAPSSEPRFQART